MAAAKMHIDNAMRKMSDAIPSQVKSQVRQTVSESIDDRRMLTVSIADGSLWNPSHTKILFRFINGLLLLIGLCLLITGAVVAAKYEIGARWIPIFLLLIGTILICMGGVGTYGAKKADDTLLCKYFYVMVVIFLMMVMFGILCFSFSSVVKTQVLANHEELGFETPSTAETVMMHFRTMGVMSFMSLLMVVVAQWCVVQLVGFHQVSEKLFLMLNMLNVLIGVLMFIMSIVAGVAAGDESWSLWLLMVPSLFMLLLAALGVKSAMELKAFKDPNNNKLLAYFGAGMVLLFFILLFGLMAMVFSDMVSAKVEDTIDSINEYSNSMAAMKAVGSLAMMVVLLLSGCMYCAWDILDKMVVSRLLLGICTFINTICSICTLGTSAFVVSFAQEEDHDKLFAHTASLVLLLSLASMAILTIAIVALWKEKTGLLLIFLKAQHFICLVLLVTTTMAFASQEAIIDLAMFCSGADENAMKYMRKLKQSVSVLGVFGLVCLFFFSLANVGAHTLRETILLEHEQEEMRPLPEKSQHHNTEDLVESNELPIEVQVDNPEGTAN